MRWLTAAVATLFAACLAATAAHAGTVRDRLTFDEMMAEVPNWDGPIHNDYFMPVGPTAPALHELSGILETSRTTSIGTARRFPRLSITFFTADGFLIPVERDTIHTAMTGWNIIVSPGRVWSEAGDNGWSRASFPFVLTGSTENESHNGLATFLFNDSEVSNLHVQIVQESSSWSRFDAWERMPLTYQPGPVEQKSELEAALKDELAQRFPTSPFASLDADADVINDMTRRFEHTTVTGLLDNGTLFRSPCYTRYGDYPYCDEMRHGVFAVTKTAGAALTLLWLTQKYGAHVLDLRIADYVAITAQHDGWDYVTFRDAINMATGIGDMARDSQSRSYVFINDVEAHYYPRFYGAVSAQGKLDAAFLAGNYDWGPGEVARYNGTHTFVLTAAMDAYLKSKEGPDAHLWDMVAQEVLLPIGIHHAPMMHTREEHGRPGLPLMHVGFYPTIDDLAKIAQLYQNRGAFEGRQLIYADEIHLLLAGDPQRGLPINWITGHGEYTYDFSFWYMPFTAAAGCWVRIPEMLGYGGNLVTLMPNGMTGIRLADADEGTDGMWDAENMAALADDMRSFCP